MYSDEEVEQATLEYFGGDELAANSWITKYALKDEEGKFVEKTPDDMHKRLAREFARIEKEYGGENAFSEDDVYEYSKDFEYVVFQGSVMAAIGNWRAISGSNCTVIKSPRDNVSSIINAGRDLANLSKRRAGVGLDISHLRPQNAKVNNAAKTTSGAWSFADYFSYVGRMIGQGGRRAALMITMHVRHPDIFEFVKMKADLEKVTGANVSVKLTDDFMEAVENDEEFNLQWPIDSDDPKIVETIRARDLFDEITFQATDNAEPGCVFWDRITQTLPAHEYEDFTTISLNPCVSGDTFVNTDKGRRKVKQLIGKDFKVVANGRTYDVKSDGFYSTGEKSVYMLECESGRGVKATMNHPFLKLCDDGQERWKPLRKLSVGDEIAISDHKFSQTKFEPIRQIKRWGREEVYDIEVDEAKEFCANGIRAHNCAEIGLSENDSCRLISNNLKHLVVNPFTEDSYFDFDKFEEVVEVAIRLSDDLVDLELEKVQQIIEKCDTEDEVKLWEKMYESGVNGRRVGCGTHGLADCLARLCLSYDSDEAVAKVREIFECLRDTAYRTSIQLAKERGPFPAWDWETEKDNEFIQSLPDDIIEEMKVHGRRNISLLTCAPTGTVSIVSQTSSGVEPVFRNSYTRRRKLDHDSDKEPDYVDDLGDRWEEYEVYHHNAREYMEMFGTDELPEYFVTSDEIDWQKRIDIQAAMSDNLCHSVSSTINLPKGTEVQVVKDLYMQAWKKGLKGVTVYVDGCRDGVLLTDESDGESGDQPENLLDALSEIGYIEPEAEITEDSVIVDGVKLGDELLNGPTKVVEREGGKYYIHMSYLPNDVERQFPVALWIHANRMGDKEWVTMNRAVRSVATLIERCGVRPELVEDCLGKIKDDPHHTRLGKIVAMAMRHNIPVTRIVKALEHIEGDYIATTLTAVRKFLKSSLNGQKVSDKVCEECGEDAIIYQEGCQVCSACGNSKCG